MKRLFLLIALIVAVLAVNAQTVVPVQTGKTYGKYSTAVVLSNAVAKYTQFNAAQNYPSTQDFLCHLDSASGNHTNVAVALFGQKFDTSAWTAIGSAVNWKGTTADTTIVISNATAARYRNFKVTYTGTGTGTTSIASQEFKLYLEN